MRILSELLGLMRCGYMYLCLYVNPFWRDVHGVLEAVFKKKMYLHFKIMYLGDVIRLEYAKQDKYLLRVC